MYFLDENGNQVPEIALFCNMLFLQGLTGNPGVSGPEGKLGPLVSKVRHLWENLVDLCLDLFD